MSGVGSSGKAGHAARAARRLLAPVRVEMLDLLRALVRTDTVAVPPDGHEAAGQRLQAETLRKRGLDVEMYDTGFLERSRHPYARRERHYSGRPNVIARISGSGRGRSLLLSGHVDTVPPGPAPWRRGPLSGHLAQGRLYGRGAWDMKGCLAAQFGVALAPRRAGARLGGNVNPPLLGHELPEAHAWTTCLHAQAESVLRRPAPVSAAEYRCDAFVCQRLFGIPTLLFGPCGAGAHNSDEYVTTTSVVRTAETLLAAARAWCGQEPVGPWVPMQSWA